MGKETINRSYPVLLADPPWKFSDRGTRLAPDYEGGQREYKHYEVMSTRDICAMGDWVREITLPKSVLFLWCPHALILDGTALKVIDAWGYKAKQEIIWVKTSNNGTPRIGGGHYTRVCSEPMILATRGAGITKRVKRRDIPNLVYAPRQKHSAKPDQSYDLIEKLFDGPYMELFARREYSSNWDTWGDEAC